MNASQVWEDEQIFVLNGKLIEIEITKINNHIAGVRLHQRYEENQ